MNWYKKAQSALGKITPSLINRFKSLYNRGKTPEQIKEFFVNRPDIKINDIQRSLGLPLGPVTSPNIKPPSLRNEITPPQKQTVVRTKKNILPGIVKNGPGGHRVPITEEKKQEIINLAKKMIAETGNDRVKPSHVAAQTGVSLSTVERILSSIGIQTGKSTPEQRNLKHQYWAKTRGGFHNKLRDKKIEDRNKEVYNFLNNEIPNVHNFDPDKQKRFYTRKSKIYEDMLNDSRLDYKANPNEILSPRQINYLWKAYQENQNIDEVIDIAFKKYKLHLSEHEAMEILNKHEKLLTSITDNGTNWYKKAKEIFPG